MSKNSKTPCPLHDHENYEFLDTSDEEGIRAGSSLQIVPPTGSSAADIISKDPLKLTYTGSKPVTGYDIIDSNGKKNYLPGKSVTIDAAYCPDYLPSPFQSPHSILANTLVEFLKSIITYVDDTYTYTINPRGDSGKTFTYEVFNPDEWELVFNLPAFKTYKVGHTLEESLQVRENKKTGETSAGTESSYKKTVANSSMFGREQTSTTTERGTRDEIVSSEGGISLRSSKYEKRSSTSHKPYDSSISELEIENHGGSGTLTYKYEGGTEPTEYTGEPDPRFPITLKRNSGVVQSDAMLLVGSAITLVGEINKAMKAFMDLKPKAGFFIDFGVDILKGKIAVKWKWDEVKDSPKTYYKISVGAEIELVTLSIRVGIGLGGFGFEAQIGIGLSGSLFFKHSGISTTPSYGGNRILIGKPEAEIKAEVFLEIKAGNFLEVKGAVESSVVLSADIFLTPSEGLCTEISSEWTGVKASFSQKASTQTPVSDLESGNGWELMPKTDFGKTVIPQEARDPDDMVTSESELQSYVSQYFDGWVANIQIKEPAKNKSAVTDTIERVTKAIWKEKDYLDMSEKSILLMLSAIAKDFANEDDGSGWVNTIIPNDIFDGYLDGSRSINGYNLPKRIHENIDVCKVYIKENSK